LQVEKTNPGQQRRPAKRVLHERRVATVLTPEYKKGFRAAAWPLEKTNPLWRPAKENKGVTSRRQRISEETQSLAK